MSHKNKTHGYSGSNMTPEYRAWINMRTRCLNKNYRDYKYYGGRGISICKEWNNFTIFLKDMGQRPSSTHSIDRKDNDGNYEPTNCKWATKSEQAFNRKCKQSNSGEKCIRLVQGKYQVRKTINKKRIRIGSYSTLNEAIDARENW